MIKYWPERPSIELNNAVADLFINTHEKLKYNLSNSTSNYLYIDILDESHKCTLFIIILKELEILLLEIIQLNLNVDNIKKIQNELFSSFISKNLKSFLKDIGVDHECIIHHNSNRLYDSDNNLLIEPLLIYLIFGSSAIKYELFQFNRKNTPKEHVDIIFENFIIQASNLIAYNILNQIQYLPNIVFFLKKYELCNHNYISIRSIALFLNELTLQNILDKYINQPKTIYNSIYPVWLISPNGLIKKYIYLLRLQDLKNISKKTYVFLFFLEILDILIPKLEKFFANIAKYLIYITINLLGNSFLLIIRTLTKCLNN